MTFPSTVSQTSPPKRLVAAAFILGLFATCTVMVLEPASFGPKTSSLRAAMETAVSLVSLLACFLLFGRFWASRALPDLLLAGAILLLALANASFGILPTLLDKSSGDIATWAHLWGRLLGGLCLALAAFVPFRAVRSTRRATALLIVTCLSGLLAVALGASFLEPSPPPSVPDVGDARSAGGYPAFAATQLVATVAFAVAAIGLSVRASRTTDELVGWLSAGAVLAAFASLNYALFDAAYGPAIQVGDLLRLAFYLVLLLGGFREIDAHRRRSIAAAQLEERQRIARNLHDGLTQDLAFLAGRLRDLTLVARTRGSEDAEPLALASETAQRALDDARAVTTSFSASPRAPLAEAIERAALEVASREGGLASVSVEPGLEVASDVAEDLVRIVREATTNAIRHGGATRQRRRADDPPAERSTPTTVEVSLASRDGLALTVEDDGRGFERERPGGQGLQSMRQRASKHGGKLTVASTPGEGTVITLRLPEHVAKPTTERSDGHAEAHREPIKH